MDFTWTTDQSIVKETAHEFAQKKLKPVAAEIEKKCSIGKELFKELGSVGLTGVMLSEKYGGMGKSRHDAVLCIEELATVSASFAWSVASNMVAGFLIQTFGSEEQKQRYLPGICNGDLVAAVAMTESTSGTNWPVSLKMRAQKNGSEYILDGSKCFITNAMLADVYLTFSRTNIQAGPAGISLLIVEKNTSGFSCGKDEEKMGLRGLSTGELVFEGCKVNVSALVGNEGSGMTFFQASGPLDCIFQATVQCGIAQAALGESIKYVKERVIGNINKPLSHFDAVQTAISEMTISVEAMRLLVYRAAMSEPGPNPIPILTAKYCSQAAITVVDRAFSLFGGYGCTMDFPIERYFRDAKTLSVQKTFDYIGSAIGKLILGVPMQ